MLQRLHDRLRNDQGGFTLIELLVVIIIIGILLAIAVPSYLSFRDRAAKSAVQANVRAIVPSIEAFYSDHSNYTGMNLATLKRSYDQGIITTDFALFSNATDYCVSSTKSGYTAKKDGPGQDMTVGATGSGAGQVAACTAA